MRILHIFDHSIPLHSGYTFRSYGILTNQHREGWETIHVTTPRHTAEGPPVEEVEGLTFYRTPQSVWPLPRIPLVREMAEIWATSRRVSAVIAETKPDIIHAHSPVLNALAAYRAARKAGLPFVYEIRAFWEDAAAAHGTCREGDARYRFTHALETHAVRQADAVTVICEGLRRDVIARGVPADKVTVIPNAVDLDRFTGEPPRDEALARDLGLNGKTVLGFIGSFYGYEGLSVLIESLAHLKHEDVRLLLVGGGPEDERLRTQVAARGLGEKVIFTGRVPHDQVERYYGVVDIFVYPRLHMRLTDLVTPLKPLEAMAQMKMVAASDVGGHRELIDDGATGTLFRAGDPADLARTVDDLLDHREAWPDRLARTRRYVEEKRNWRTSVANYVAVYERLARISRNKST